MLAPYCSLHRPLCCGAHASVLKQTGLRTATVARRDFPRRILPLLPKPRHLPRFKSSLHFPYRPCPRSAEDYIVREPRAAGDTRTMFKYLGRATASHPWLVCLAWVIVVGV